MEWTRFDFGSALASRLVQGVGQGLYLAAAYVYIQSRLDSHALPVSTRRLFGDDAAVAGGGAALRRLRPRSLGRDGLLACGRHPGIAGLALTIGFAVVPRPPSGGGLQIIAGWRPGAWEPLLAVLTNGILFGFCTAYLAVALRERGIPLAASSPQTRHDVRQQASGTAEHRGDEPAAAGRWWPCADERRPSRGRSRWNADLARCPWRVAFGFGYSLTYPVIAAWITDGAAPGARAGAQALLNTAFNVGLFAMPLPETWLVAALGYDGALTTLAGFGLATALLLALRARGRS